MGCERCGQGPAARVELSHNIGLLIMRRSETQVKNLCQRCTTAAYFHHQIRNLTLGWWGLISFFATGAFLIGNTVTLVGTLLQLRARKQRVKARLSPTVVRNPQQRLEPFNHTIRLRLEDKDRVPDIARDLAEVTQVSVGQAAAYIQTVAESRVP